MILFDRKHFLGKDGEGTIAGHVRWAIAFVLLLALTTVWYAVYQAREPQGPSGGTISGLLFGVAGTLCMLFAGLFNARKRLPRIIWLGSAQFWMRGHIWLGTLSLPLILFHCGFRFGGALEFSLMIVMVIVWLSGIFGIVMQQYLPRTMRASVSAEAMYQQVGQVCESLRDAADSAMKNDKVCGDLLADTAPSPELLRLKNFYLEQVRPYLGPKYRRDSRLHNTADAHGMFDAVRSSVLDAQHVYVDDLEKMCDERRGLEVQRRLHGWLHSWLLLHIPLSMTLLTLGIVHIFSALWY